MFQRFYRSDDKYGGFGLGLSIVAAIFTAAEVVVPLFGDVLPRGVLVLLAFSASVGAAIARLVAQPEMHR